MIFFFTIVFSTENHSLLRLQINVDTLRYRLCNMLMFTYQKRNVLNLRLTGFFFHLLTNVLVFVVHILA